MVKRKAADILLVEDDPYEIELTMHAVYKHQPGCLIDVVRDGEEAVHYLQYQGIYKGRESAQPRLVVLDINLPRRSGIEVLASIKQDLRIRFIPVVMLTSSRDSADVRESYRRGANGYVVKPLDFRKFDEVIGSLCVYWLTLNCLPQTGFANIAPGG